MCTTTRNGRDHCDGRPDQPALTGAIFSQDRYAINEATMGLRQAAGNFYINDKPNLPSPVSSPSAEPGFGTNDKAGSIRASPVGLTAHDPETFAHT